MKTGIRGQKSEVRSQRSESRSQRIENRSQNYNIALEFEVGFTSVKLVPIII
jgi:hypothetical protein